MAHAREAMLHGTALPVAEICQLKNTATTSLESVARPCSLQIAFGGAVHPCFHGLKSEVVQVGGGASEITYAFRSVIFCLLVLYAFRLSVGTPLFCLLCSLSATKSNKILLLLLRLHAHMQSISALAAFDIALIRHGNTGPAATDLERSLTDKGVQQANKAATSYVSRRLGSIMPLVVCSAAGRCVETAYIAMTQGEAVEGGKTAFELVKCQKMYDALMQPGGSAVFKRIGYAPLRAYREDSTDGAQMRELLDEYATLSLAEVAAVAARAPAADARRTLCVFGHAVYLPSIAFALAKQRGLSADSLDRVLDCNTAEACGYLVTADSVELLE